MGILLAMQGAVAQGVLWGIMTLGVLLTFRILNIADMTVDGSFATGGAVTAVLIVRGMNPLFSLVFVFAVGMITGLCTGLLHTKLKIPVILSGILSMIALYSINIRIMGRANTPIIGVPTIMNGLQEKFGLSPNTASLLVGIIFCIFIIGIIYWFFGTEIGSAIRATGNNENMVRALGIDTDLMKILGLMIANGLVSLSGALVAQSQGYADVGMGTGTIVIGLASIIIGEVLRGRHISFYSYLISVVLGSVVYRIIIAVVLQLGLKSTDLKLLTAVIVASSLALPVIGSNVKKRAKNISPSQEGM
ncbi:ABC transporter permease [Treponema parvum]|uniref:ABC transporter permease n=1 Tax=Treponema parvum TaxID=138851 RepID=A0A975F0I4_9SPIR|nr:ABC transporter permease [Treponema parvum]QTQ12259.1 ABC transporter permease [Treponema parvum]